MKFGEKGILSIGNGPGIDYSILLFGLKEYTSGIVIQCLVGLKNKKWNKHSKDKDIITLNAIYLNVYINKYTHTHICINICIDMFLYYMLYISIKKRAFLVL